MGHAIWKGHISFGLVSIPVSLHSAEAHDDLSFSMLDRRDLAPIGYRKVNKLTGEEVGSKDVVKGYEVEKGEFVLVTPEDLKRANADATRTIEILAFVDPAEVPPSLFERPYWLAPLAKGEKAYRLLADTLRETNKIGIAKVVITHRQHLAALTAQGPVLQLELMRFAEELRTPADADVDEDALARVKVNPKERALAKRLVEDMSDKFDHAAYHDEYRADLREFLEAKARSKTGHVKGKGSAKPPRAGKVIDLMEILQQSVAKTERRRRRKGA